MAAPVGNNNEVKGKRWYSAIDRALAMRCKGDGIKALDALAESLLTKCEQGDVSALRELGDRLDGKANQPVALSGSIHVSLAQSDSEL